MLPNYRCFIFFFAILFFVPLKNSYTNESHINDVIDPYCSGVDPEEFFHDKKIENIEIITDNKKRWAKNILNTFVEFKSEDSKTEHKDFFNFRIGENRKKNHNATLIVKFKKKNLSCKFRAKIRITGDGEWHLKWKNGNPLSSLYVKLIDGHINSITKFKLLLPASRGDVLLPENMSKGADTEVFVTTLLRELGFLAPRTYLVTTKVNGVIEKYIFQEDLRKEFLEHFQLKEGPILEGDERFTVMQRDENANYSLSLSRLTNKNFSLQGETNARIALTAVSNLNLIYLQNHQIDKNIRMNISKDILLVNTEKYFLNKFNREKFQIYESIIEALGASHGQSKDDRRFYFDPINKYFVPIYYDGKATIISRRTNYKNINRVVSADAKSGALKSIELINNMNHHDFVVKLNNSGFIITYDEYKKLLKRLIDNLTAINNSKVFKVKFLNTKKYFSDFDTNVSKDKELVFINFKRKEFNFCSFDLNTCSVKQNNSLEFNKLLSEIISQRYKGPKKNTLPSTKYLFVYDDIEYQNENNFISNNWKLKKISENFILKYNENTKVDISKENKLIKISQLSNAGRVIITGDKIENWNIVFTGYQGQINQNIPKDYLGLPGCLTFLDIKIKNLNILSKNSTCEDSLNFIRVSGEIDTLEVLNSSSDAIDFDFSKVNINHIKVKSANNDCLDLSYGNYSINKISAENCLDKAISVGEKSIVQFKQIYIKNAHIAVAVKDSSLASINYAEIHNSPVCFSAYRKKQEFAGSKIKVLKTNCKVKQNYEQQGSKIVLNL